MGLGRMAKAKAVQLLLMAISCLLPHRSQQVRRRLSQASFQECRAIGLFPPPVIIGHAAAIAQQIGIPIFASADVSVAGFEGANADLHVVVGAWETWQVIALNQPGSQVAHHLQQMAQTQLFLLRAFFGLEEMSQFLEPLVKPTSDLGIADLLRTGSEGSIEDMLQTHDPLLHLPDLRKRLTLFFIQAHNRLEAFEPLLGSLGRMGPLFSSRSKLL